MKKYIQFIERNDHEGETWYFYIPVKGNSAKINAIKTIIRDSDTYSIGRELTEDKVDILIEYDVDVGYMARHNKVSGIEDVPEEIDLEDEDPFYKGALFTYD